MALMVFTIHSNPERATEGIAESLGWSGNTVLELSAGRVVLWLKLAIGLQGGSM